MTTLLEQFAVIKAEADKLAIEAGMCEWCHDTGLVVMNGGRDDEYETMCECKVREIELGDYLRAQEDDEDMSDYSNDR